MSRSKIKICGITSKQQALEIASLEVDALGFILYPQSPRYISPNQLKEILHELPPFTKSVGVFVNEPLKTIEEIYRMTGLNMVQLSGEESPDYCLALSHKGISWIKAFRVKDKISLQDLSHYPSKYILLDAWSADEYGGTGTTFNWELVSKLGDKYKIVLAGGINPGNVQKAVRTLHPYAIDVSSGVENTPGVKSILKIKQLIDRIEDM